MQILHHHKNQNVHPAERWLSVVGGGALAVSGLSKGRSGIMRALTGAMLLKRGLTGHCDAYQFLGVRTAPSKATIPYELGIMARSSVTIAAPREKVFEFWEQLENLPRFMRHLVSVERTGDRRSHWVAKGPADKKVEWDAETINVIPNELISWKSLPGSDVDSAGSVRFKDAPGGRGTELRVEMQYNPPAGVLGAYVAKLFGREPEQEIDADLGRLKQYMESGEFASIEGQPRGSSHPQSTYRETQKKVREAHA